MFDEISDLARQVLEDILFVENHEVSSRNIAIAAVNRPRSLVEGGWSMFIMLKDGELGSDQTPLELCAFCGKGLNNSQSKLLQECLKTGDRVLPNCGDEACLQANPKANFGNGWKIMPKRSRKRKAKADEPRKAKRGRKHTKPNWSRKPTKPKKRSRKKPKPKLQSR